MRQIKYLKTFESLKNVSVFDDSFIMEFSDFQKKYIKFDDGLIRKVAYSSPLSDGDPYDDFGAASYWCLTPDTLEYYSGEGFSYLGSKVDKETWKASLSPSTRIYVRSKLSIYARDNENEFGNLPICKKIKKNADAVYDPYNDIAGLAIYNRSVINII